MSNTGSGPLKKADPEQLFDLYYNAGRRRTYVEVERLTKEQAIPDATGCSNATIRRYADEFDWERRADELDAEARRISDRRLANLVATHRMREIETTATLQTKFMRRLIPSTVDNPNPAEIDPLELTPRDFIELGKFFELLTGGATERSGAEGPQRIEEMERDIMQMDARETERPALAAGEGSTE